MYLACTISRNLQFGYSLQQTICISIYMIIWLKMQFFGAEVQLLDAGDL